MGRRKIKIQPLPDSQIRAKFKKRKLGLIKKAYELGTLCGAQVALIIFSKDGEEVIDKGYNATTVEIIQRYWNQVHCRNQSEFPQQQIPAIQVPQFEPNSDSSSPIDPHVQQEVAAMDPNLQHGQYGMNPQVQQDQYGMNPQVQQGRFMNPQMQQGPYMNSHVQQEVPTDPQMQQGPFMNSHTQQEVPTNPQMQQGPFMNSHTQQEVPTDPQMQQGQYMNARRQQSMTRIPQMQQGIQYSMGPNFVDTSSNYMQDTMQGNQQFHAQGHQTQFENRGNVRYNNRQPSEPGYRN